MQLVGSSTRQIDEVIKLRVKLWTILLLICVVVIGGCAAGSGDGTNSSNGIDGTRNGADGGKDDGNELGMGDILRDVSNDPGDDLDQPYETRIEKVEGDFIYRLVTEQAVYESGEPPSVYAELEYIGEDDQIVIYHAMSPFYFPARERTRDYGIAYVMAQPLIATTLAKGKPLRESYQGGGGYSERDPQEYVEFIKQVGSGQFPAGIYEVSGHASFFVESADGTQIDYRIGGEIVFEVAE